MPQIDQFLAHYGYWALFGLLMLGIVGPLIPDETILVLAGIAIHRGEMEPLPAFASGFAGSLCGITLSYVLGRTGALYAIRHIGWLQRRADRHLPKAHEWFERYGKWTLFFGYFVAGVRHFTALAAGTSRLPAPEFARYAYPGGFLWVATFLTVGYYLGGEWGNIAHRLDLAIVIFAILIVVALFLWQRRRKN